LHFQQFKLLAADMVRMVNIRHSVKFRAGRPNHCHDMAVFEFSRWRSSAILNLLYSCLRPPRRVGLVGGLYRCAKFGRNTQVPVLCEFGLKMPIHAYGGKNVKWGHGKLLRQLSIPGELWS